MNSSACYALNEAEYKVAKEDFVTGHHGGSPYEVLALLAISAVWLPRTLLVASLVHDGQW